jgi:hypothetical protein
VGIGPNECDSVLCSNHDVLLFMVRSDWSLGSDRS